MDQKTLPDCQVWFDGALLSECDAASAFEPVFWEQNSKVIGSARGRGITLFVQGERLPMALRHYHRGGLFGKLVSDQYWFSGWKNTRCYQEFVLLRHLRESGVNVPQPVAAKASKAGLLSYRADILVELIQNAKDLVKVLADTDLTPHIWFAIGKEVAKMHHAGVCHTDLNAHNILLDDNNRVWLIDFDKCGLRKGNSWKQTNLNRLLRSFLKEKSKAGIKFDEANHWGWLVDGYRSSGFK
ncbi:3-deoxy-D-manno-octulosonic acid kinase [Grimontia sp. S25]|uniref:3-deoxy-D-manno-octulosonic acid kinase n=1 Tax=Grimontia sedimenti TaxID=2711294 RepID=A0A6M1RA93_9GAMM|nr:3-deoxy-D-manno-octulosonic acid kinase [Grimontia sedimenti]NGN99183.1 3-deoxy-D-manno-octulosonic acid kinase [Grimontia sedimenti]